MEITVSLLVPNGKTCGERVSNYSHDGDYFGCKYYKYNTCLIFDKRLTEGEYEKSSKWQGYAKAINKCKECMAAEEKSNDTRAD